LKQPWREIFDAADRALELEPEEQRAFVEQYLLDHPAEGAELKALIERAESPSSLEMPASVFAAPLLREDSGEESNDTLSDSHNDGAVFGPYRVRREVGWGKGLDRPALEGRSYQLSHSHGEQSARDAFRQERGRSRSLSFRCVVQHSDQGGRGAIDLVAGTPERNPRRFRGWECSDTVSTERE